MKVVEWISGKQAEKYPEAPCTDLGGWFGRDKPGERWSDYIEDWGPKAQLYHEAIREAVLASEIRGGGFWHQDQGVPLFDDGTVASFSFRAWGDLMAAIWSTAEDRDYSYIDFAWTECPKRPGQGERTMKAVLLTYNWETEKIFASPSSDDAEDPCEQMKSLQRSISGDFPEPEWVHIVLGDSKAKEESAKRFIAALTGEDSSPIQAREAADENPSP